MHNNIWSRFIIGGLIFLSAINQASACSIFAVKGSNNQIIAGRNFDWLVQGGEIHFFPPNRVYGVPTKGLCIIEQMGTDRPYEGMNSDGLFVAMAVVSDGASQKTHEKNALIINDLGLIRFILERAATANEALLIAKKFKIDYMTNKHFPKIQYLFADAQGTVGFYEEGLHSFFTKLSQYEGQAIINDIKSDLSVSTVKNAEEAMALLEQAKQTNTVWSCVYNLSQKELRLCIEQNYKASYVFKLNKELASGYHSIDFGELKLPAYH